MILELATVKAIDFFNTNPIFAIGMQLQQDTPTVVTIRREAQVPSHNGRRNICGAIRNIVIAPKESPIVGRHTNETTSNQLIILTNATGRRHLGRRKTHPITACHTKFRNACFPNQLSRLFVESDHHMFWSAGRANQLITINQGRFPITTP